jgi:hypothetical protein
LVWQPQQAAGGELTVGTSTEIINRAEYQALIEKKPDRELMVEIAMRQYDMQMRCNQLCDNAPSKKQIAYNVGGLAGFVLGAAATFKAFLH